MMFGFLDADEDAKKSDTGRAKEGSPRPSHGVASALGILGERGKTSSPFLGDWFVEIDEPLESRIDDCHQSQALLFLRVARSAATG